MDCDVNLTDHVSDSWQLVFRDESRFWIQRVVQPVVVLVGILGNLVTVVVLTRPRMSSSTNTYLTALAVSDLVYLVFLYALSLENHPDNKTAEYYWYWQTWRFLLWIVDSASKSVGLLFVFVLNRFLYNQFMQHYTGLGFNSLSDGLEHHMDCLILHNSQIY